MTITKANQVIDRVARIIASVHGVLNAEDARQYEEAKATLGSGKCSDTDCANQSPVGDTCALHPHIAYRLAKTVNGRK